jgi:Carboxypeptidase regulatory-like domain
MKPSGPPNSQTVPDAWRGRSCWWGAGLVRLGLVWVGVVASAPASAQQIRGIVVDEGTGVGVALVQIVVISEDGDSVASTLTNERGLFSVSPPPGITVIRAAALGYRPVRTEPFELDEGEIRTFQIHLPAQPIQIEGLVVDAGEAALADNGFRDRMAEGRGQFITPEDIAASAAIFTPDLFEGLKNVRPEFNKPAWARWLTFSSVDRGRCAPRLYIDGVRFAGALPGEGLDDVVPRENLLAAEVYWGPFQAPMQYLGTSRCGVILLWTYASVGR